MKISPDLRQRLSELGPSTEPLSEEHSTIEREFRLENKGIRTINSVNLSKLITQVERYMPHVVRDLEKVDIKITGLENLPTEPFILAMNHTNSRYPWAPLQKKLYQDQGKLFTAWVKPRDYIQNYLFRDNGMIFVPTTNYLIIAGFKGKYPFQKVLSREEVYWLKTNEGLKPRKVVQNFKKDGYESIKKLHLEIMRRVGNLTNQALNSSINVMILPEGTRSTTLGSGRIGIVQAAVAYNKLILPVGCNGAEKIYPGFSPFANPGEITYRISKPVRIMGINPKEVQLGMDITKQRSVLQKQTNNLMDILNSLIDKKYQRIKPY
jgi:1-acyl-sn-glycerol-3-phosphate acyltransferase